MAWGFKICFTIQFDFIWFYLIYFIVKFYLLIFILLPWRSIATWIFYFILKSIPVWQRISLSNCMWRKYPLLPLFFLCGSCTWICIAGVGKSCLLLRFSDDTFTTSFITTIGCISWPLFADEGEGHVNAALITNSTVISVSLGLTSRLETLNLTGSASSCRFGIQLAKNVFVQLLQVVWNARNMSILWDIILAWISAFHILSHWWIAYLVTQVN